MVCRCRATDVEHLVQWASPVKAQEQAVIRRVALTVMVSRLTRGSGSTFKCAGFYARLIRGHQGGQLIALSRS